MPIKLNPTTCKESIILLNTDNDDYTVPANIVTLKSNKAEEIFNYILNTPYEKIKDSLKENGKDGSELANNLLFSLLGYAKNNKKRLTKFENLIGYDIYRTYDNFQYYYNESFKNGASVKGKFYLFKKMHSIHLLSIDKKDVKKNSIYGDNGPVYYDARNIHGMEHTLLRECHNLLKDADSKVRGSSSEYKEIQREIDSLQNYIERSRSFEAGSNDYNLAQHYIFTMLEVLSEKAGNYIEKRKKTELEVPFNSYKGKRIFAMRKLQYRLEKMAERQNILIKNMSLGEGSVATGLANMLMDKSEKISYSKRLAVEIKLLSNNNTKYKDTYQGRDPFHGKTLSEQTINSINEVEEDNKRVENEYANKYKELLDDRSNDPVLDGMDKVFYGRKIKFDKLAQIHNYVRHQIFTENSNSKNNYLENLLNVYKTDNSKINVLNQERKRLKNIENQKNGFTFTDTDGTVIDDYDTCICLVKAKLASIDYKLEELNSPVEEKDLYERNTSGRRYDIDDEFDKLNHDIETYKNPLNNNIGPIM